MPARLLRCLLPIAILAICAHAQSSPCTLLADGHHASPGDLERRGDQMRAAKAYPDALDCYRAALAASPGSAALNNKMGITELISQHFRQAKEYFERAVKLDRKHADAYNNLGVTEYLTRHSSRAVKNYRKAIEYGDAEASYYSNLGTAYFSQKKWDEAMDAYRQAVSLDPEVFEHSSNAGVAGQLSTPQDRSHFYFVLARLYARSGSLDRSLVCLRRAMEEGYKQIDDVFHEADFAALRKDPRFAQLMAEHPAAISE